MRSEGSTDSDRVVYSAVCRAQSNDPQTYVGVGKLNGRPVKVSTRHRIGL